MAVQYTGHVIKTEITWQEYWTAIGWSSCDALRTILTTWNNIINYIYWKCKIKIKKLSLEQTWDSQALLVGYNSLDWLRIGWIWAVWTYYFYKTCTDEFSYNFIKVLYQFLETGTSDRCLICIVQRLRSQVSSYTPLSESLFKYV